MKLHCKDEMERIRFAYPKARALPTRSAPPSPICSFNPRRCGDVFVLLDNTPGRTVMQQSCFRCKGCAQPGSRM